MSGLLILHMFVVDGLSLIIISLKEVRCRTIGNLLMIYVDEIVIICLGSSFINVLKCVNLLNNSFVELVFQCIFINNELQLDQHSFNCLLI